MSMLLGGHQTFEDKWPGMKEVVLKLLNQQEVTKKEWHDLFWDVHSVCLWDNLEGPIKVKSSLECNISAFVKDAQSRIKLHQEGNELLNAYITEWKTFFEQCSFLPEPFKQLEASLGQDTKKKSDSRNTIVRKMMLDCWNENIFSGLYEQLKDRTMILIKKEREGDSLDAQLVIGVRQSFVNLCSDSEKPLEIYHKHFESAYIKTTEDFYNQQSIACLEREGVTNYMRYAYQKLNEETARATRYLESSSLPLLVDSCVEVLVSQYTAPILAECRGMITDNKTEQLNLMFNLMKRVKDGVKPMLEYLEEHIMMRGLAHMKSCQEIITTDSEKYIDLLLSLFNQFSELVKNSFEDDPQFLTTRDKAFEKVVNDYSVFNLELQSKAKQNPIKLPPESRCPELLANFCDMLLRKTPLSKKLTTDEIDKKLMDVLLLLKYVANKDVFMRYHKAHLTRRLILGTSADNEKEENMVEGLREVGMPADYVNKLARMFQDIKVSEDLNQLFKEGRNDKIADLANIKILNAGAWSRRSDKIPVSLPSALEDLISDIEDFYRGKHTGRKLNWNHLMSNGVMNFKSDVGQYDVEMTTFQMAALYVWNARPREEVSYEGLKLATQLPDNELRKTLWSLVANGKLKRQVLLCKPPVSSIKDFCDGTMLCINHQFALMKGGKVQKRGRVNLIGRLQLSSDKSREEDNEGITQLRMLRTQVETLFLNLLVQPKGHKKV